MFYTSAGLIAAFVIFGTFWTDYAKVLFEQAQSLISRSLGWFYHGAVTFCLLFCLWLIVSRYGSIRLGKDTDRPAYGYMTWFAMLFSAGMGIGILFWSVAEPVMHCTSPPFGEPLTTEAAFLAMDITLLHWGLHGWCVYVVVGLGLALAAYRLEQPLTFRSVLYPILGDRARGLTGDAIDIFAILGTMFGVATSLGMGAQQINAGFNYLFGLPVSLPTQLVLIAAITALATASVVSGLNRGILILSRIAIWLAVVLLIYVVVAGPTAAAFESAFMYGGHYLKTLVRQGFWSDLGGTDEWQGDWTLFYWGWWIAWSPFVGTFVARISRGRTVREFVLGVLIVPTLVTCFWFCVFGGMGLNAVLDGSERLAQAVNDNFSIAIFVFFSSLPGEAILCGGGLIIILLFFVTSSDSASLVIDYIASGGDPDPPKRQRVFWAASEGVVAAVLLIGGGLAPMRVFQLITGLPLAVILLLTCAAIVVALHRERSDMHRSE